MDRGTLIGIEASDTKHVTKDYPGFFGIVIGIKKMESGQSAHVKSEKK
jgi:hypothetical protein